MQKEKTKRYLVTGAAGFIGARFIESCNRRNISVISVDQNEFFKTRNEHQSLHFGEIISIEDLLPALKAQSLFPSAIIHLGALTDTRESDVGRLNHYNVEYSQALWNYATQNQIPLVYASSAATYGDGKMGYDDDENQIPSLEPLNLYGKSKQIFDLWALDQEKSGSHPPMWSGFKFFNVYGFGERHKNFMSSVVLQAYDQIHRQGYVNLFKSHREGIADGHQKRDFVFVEDVVEVLHFALNHPISRGIYNLGTGKARPFYDLAKAVFAALGLPDQIRFIDTPPGLREQYQYFTQATMGRLRDAGYKKPFTSLEDGVQNYIQRLKQST